MMVNMEMVRTAMQSFCKGSKQVSNAQLYELLSLTNEKEKDSLRARINGLVQQGEAKRVGRGIYEYNFKHRPRKNTTFPIVWRFVRMQKLGWSFKEASQLTRISYTQVLRYCTWLENAGYIIHFGKIGTTNLYRATELADRTPETPYPAMTDKNPFERENSAAARLATLMLCHDPYQTTVAKEIVKHCNTLLARFNKPYNQETTGETV